jgi:hypothetical protein
MQSLELIQGYFNPKQLKVPLSFEIKIPFDSEARTFDEVFRRIDFRHFATSQIVSVFILLHNKTKHYIFLL